MKLALLHRRRGPDHFDLIRNSSHGSKQSELASLFDKALTGSLDRFSVSDVIEFVNAIQETGILDVSDDRSGTVRQVLFDNGEIVGAFDGMYHGEDAGRKILRTIGGSFTFIRGEIPPATTPSITRP